MELEILHLFVFLSRTQRAVYSWIMRNNLLIFDLTNERICSNYLNLYSKICFDKKYAFFNKKWQVTIFHWKFSISFRISRLNENIIDFFSKPEIKGTKFSFLSWRFRLSEQILVLVSRHKIGKRQFSISSQKAKISFTSPTA